MTEKCDFIRLCGQLVFGAGGLDAWDQLTETQKERYCSIAGKTGWDLVFISALKERLPKSCYQLFRKRYQVESLKRMIEYQDLTSFYQYMESEKIHFMPVKGADLAYRIYPDSALRPHGDWDILFREEECSRVIPLLQQYGWKTFSGYEPRRAEHHYDRMHNGRHSLEAHFLLPHFGKATSEEIWHETVKETEYHHVLTPEMNLLLLSAHAALDSYTHESEGKILRDAGMILKHDPVDWEQVHRLADRWGILRPDILLHVWDDFFPAGHLPPEDPSCKQQKLIREIFEIRDITREVSVYEKQVAAAEPSIRWMKKRLKFYNPALICLKYHLSPHQNGKILLYGVRDFLEKSLFFLKHFRKRNPELLSYYKKVSELEKHLNHEK